MSDDETRHKLWRPRRSDLWAAVGFGMVVTQVVRNASTGEPADTTLTMAGLGLMLGVPIFSRVDAARNGKS